MNIFSNQSGKTINLFAQNNPPTSPQTPVIPPLKNNNPTVPTNVPVVSQPSNQVNPFQANQIGQNPPQIPSFKPLPIKINITTTIHSAGQQLTHKLQTELLYSLDNRTMTKVKEEKLSSPVKEKKSKQLLKKLQEESIKAEKNYSLRMFKYTIRIAIETLNYYLKVLPQQEWAYEKSSHIKNMNLRISDVANLSKCMETVMTTIDGMMRSKEKRGDKFQVKQKKELVKYVALHIQLIELVYQKLLHLLTFEKKFMSEGDSNEQYEKLLEVIHKFRDYIQILVPVFAQDWQHEPNTMKNCYIFINEVVERARIKAGDAYYREKQMPYEILMPKRKPNKPFYDLLITGAELFDNQSVRDKKQKNFNVLPVYGGKKKFELALPISQKYQYLIQ